MLVHQDIASPLGSLRAVASPSGVQYLEFVDCPDRLPVLSSEPGGNAHTEQLAVELLEYFSGSRRDFDVALDLVGTEFQRSVWNRLLAIEYGHTTSYGAIARAMNRPRAARAVGHANGRNHIAIVIPCHRVVTSTGDLRHYGGGLWRKRALLELEKSR